MTGGAAPSPPLYPCAAVPGLTAEAPRYPTPTAEGCRSGRTGRSRKPLRVQALRGFKSLPLRLSQRQKLRGYADSAAAAGTTDSGSISVGDRWSPLVGVIDWRAPGAQTPVATAARSRRRRVAAEAKATGRPTARSRAAPSASLVEGSLRAGAVRRVLHKPLPGLCRMPH